MNIIFILRMTKTRKKQKMPKISYESQKIFQTAEVFAGKYLIGGMVLASFESVCGVTERATNGSPASILTRLDIL